MTERTFRDASPLRRSSPMADHPPIPPMPQNLPQNRKPNNTRPMSAEPPLRVKSPVLKEPKGRGMSLDRGNVKPRNETIPPLPKTKLAKIDTKTTGAGVKRASINFSRPMSPALSPPASPLAPANGKITKPASGTFSTGAKDNVKSFSPNQKATPATKKERKNVGKSAEGTGKFSTVVNESSPLQNDKPRISAGQTSRSSQKSPEPQSTSTTGDGISASKAARASGKLNKQPSMVKEDADGEALAEQVAKLPATKFDENTPITPSNTPNGKALIASDITPITSQALTTPETGDSTRRRSSLSPARTARFSTQPVYDMYSGIKHEPPLRAASPAKSALKQSPSPRGPSPALMHSDISDNVSVASEEGKRKRRSVRVSFEDGPVAVGDAAESNVRGSPVLFSPQNKDPTSRPQFNFRKKLDDADTDAIITPVPTLPSFDRIRGRNDRHDDDDHKVLYGDEQARKNLVEMTSSNDHAISAIVAQDIASKQPANDPVPPQVTSVEGSGYHSDAELSDDENQSSTTSKATELLPTIAVVPATPGHETDKEARENWLPNTSDDANRNENTIADVLQQKNSIEATEVETQKIDNLPERESIVEPEPESAQREHDPNSLTIGIIAESLRKQDDEHNDSDSGDSVYSDAAEEPADPEGDGFGSINAIVDSPLVSPIVPSFANTNKGVARAQDESPSPAGRERPPPDWEATKSYWSSVSESKKAQNDPELVGIAITSPPGEREVDPSKVEKPVTPEKSIARSQNTTPKLKTTPKAPVVQTKTTPNQASKRSVLKDSLRQTSDPVPPKDETSAMKKTMRGPRPTSMTSNASTAAPRNSRVDSLRKEPGQSKPITVGDKMPSTPPIAPAKANTKKSPVRSTQPSLANGNANGSAKRMSTMSTKSAPPTQSLRSAPPKLSRTMSNDSDSSSSFKREKARNPRQEGSYSMKRSMRSGPAQVQSGTSPQNPRTTVTNRPASMSGVSLRASMRDNPVTTLRPSSVRVQSPSGSFFSRKKKTDIMPPMPRNFSDSSRGEMPTTHRSRFADSSDEEDVLTNLTPVRGIPRRTVEEDSTDLDDSDEESKPKPAPVVASSNAVPQTSGLATKSMRSQSPIPTPVVTNLTPIISLDKKRRSIFGVLGRRKDKSKIGKSELDSAARRDTPLERTKFERKEINVRATTPEPSTPLETPLESPAASPRSPTGRPGKLQRRNTPQRLGSDSWFLPPSIPADEPVVRRPTTSDGAPSRPNMGTRNFSNTTYTADGVAVGRTGKKKRFPMLRKAFGLHD